MKKRYRKWKKIQKAEKDTENRKQVQKAGKKGKNRKKPVSPPIRRVARYLLPTHSNYAKYVCTSLY